MLHKIESTVARIVRVIVARIIRVAVAKILLFFKFFIPRRVVELVMVVLKSMIVKIHVRLRVIIEFLGASFIALLFNFSADLVRNRTKLPSSEVFQRFVVVVRHAVGHNSTTRHRFV